MTHDYIRSLCIEDYGHPYFLWALTENNNAGDLLMKEESPFTSPFREDFIKFIFEPKTYNMNEEWKIISQFDDLKQLPDFLIKDKILNQNHKNALLQEISVII